LFAEKFAKQIVRGKKKVVKQKYFLLTSKEAHESKLQEQQDKVTREKDKAEKASMRKQKLEERARKVSFGSGSSSENPKKKATRDVPNSKLKSNHKQSKTKKDCTPCGVCGIVHLMDTTGRNWIHCSSCRIWFHNASQGLDEEHTVAFMCIACESS